MTATKPQPDPRLVFLDLETTGLDPERDVILEIAFVVVTPKLEEVGNDTRLIDHRHDIDDLITDKFVREMHEKSGLVKDIQACQSALWPPTHSLPIYCAQTDVLSYLRRLGFQRGLTTLAGSSVHFDRAFLKRHMPKLEAFFHHRHVDVSTLTALRDRWNPRPADALVKEPAHRALADCRASLEQLRWFRAALIQNDVSLDFERTP